MGVVTLMLCVLGRLQLCSYAIAVGASSTRRNAFELEAGVISLGRNEFRHVAAR